VGSSDISLFINHGLSSYDTLMPSNFAGLFEYKTAVEFLRNQNDHVENVLVDTKREVWHDL
jgi:hypothetical protein